MYDKIYYHLATTFYLKKMENYIILDDKEYRKKLINGEIDYFQKEIYETKCFSNVNFIKRIIELHSYFFNFIPSDYQNDYNFVLSLIDINPNIYQYISFKEDDLIIKKALKKNPFVLKYVPDHIKDNEKYVLLTQNKEKKVVLYASDRLREKYGYYSSYAFLGKNLYL